MIASFHAALAALRPAQRNPLIALVVSDEAGTYRPEMQWLAAQLQLQGKRVFCLRPEDLFPLENALFFDVEGNPEKIDVIYRFLELFARAFAPDSSRIVGGRRGVDLAADAAFSGGENRLALFHHHLVDFWAER